MGPSSKISDRWDPRESGRGEGKKTGGRLVRARHIREIGSPCSSAAYLANGGTGTGTACRTAESGEDRDSGDGEAAARGGAAVGGVAGLAGQRTGRRLPHAYLQLPQPDPRSDSLRSPRLAGRSESREIGRSCVIGLRFGCRVGGGKVGCWAKKWILICFCGEQGWALEKSVLFRY